MVSNKPKLPAEAIELYMSKLVDGGLRLHESAQAAHQAGERVEELPQQIGHVHGVTPPVQSEPRRANRPR